MKQTISAKAQATQMVLVEQALREILVHVPSNHVDIQESNDGRLTIFARDVPIYQSKVNMFSMPDVTVEGAWLAWPPPRSRRTRRSKRSAA